nr:MAG TPA: NikA, BACTERIAL CONJUGATION, RELAXASE, DNA [Caudoviricetes sp.]
MTEEVKPKGKWGGARPNTGGARPGAGRKKLEGDAVTKQVQFRLTAEQTAIVKEFVRMLKAGEITLEDFKK